MGNNVPTPIGDLMPRLHDAVCEKWSFDYGHKELVLFFQSDDGKKHRMTYRGVYAHQMVSCDFWGPSPRIYGFEVVEKQSGLLYNQLVQTITREAYEESFISELTNGIETKMKFISGDVLFVLCKSILVE